ncbi:MAG: hypothetical protein WEF51_00290 [Chloroflexota bacterium]
MEGLLILGFLIGAVATVGLLALRFGVDSRDGSTDPRVPERGLSI